VTSCLVCICDLNELSLTQKIENQTNTGMNQSLVVIEW
jgi:hypothetical protein